MCDLRVVVFCYSVITSTRTIHECHGEAHMMLEEANGNVVFQNNLICSA